MVLRGVAMYIFDWVDIALLPAVIFRNTADP
jgi:hypothetical protein